MNAASCVMLPSHGGLSTYLNALAEHGLVLQRPKCGGLV